MFFKKKKPVEEEKIRTFRFKFLFEGFEFKCEGKINQKEFLNFMQTGTWPRTSTIRKDDKMYVVNMSRVNVLELEDVTDSKPDSTSKIVTLFAS